MARLSWRYSVAVSVFSMHDAATWTLSQPNDHFVVKAVREKLEHSLNELVLRVPGVQRDVVYRRDRRRERH